MIGTQFTYDAKKLGIFEAIVVAYDPEVGLTAVKADDPEFNLMCINVAAARKHDPHSNHIEEILKRAVKQIKRGYYSPLCSSHSTRVPTSKCAFR